MKNETVRLSELGSKRAVSTKTGEDLGWIRDVEIDRGNGAVTAAVIVRRRGILGLFGGGERIIAWKDICLVGEDTVLVDAERTKEGGCGGNKKTFGIFE